MYTVLLMLFHNGKKSLNNRDTILLYVRQKFTNDTKIIMLLKYANMTQNV